ncbi:MAG: hypothetical protein ACKO6N_29260 [Myxococcota bacterium]
MSSTQKWRILCVLTSCLCLPWACVEESPVLLSIPVIFQPLEQTPLLLADGSSLELQEARLTLADLRLERPVENQALRWNPLQPALALAHPGHEFSGNVAGELLGTYTLDLLGEPTTLGQAQLYTGQFATAQLHLPGETQGPILTLVGVREYEGKSLPVTLALSLEYEVHGIPFEQEILPDSQAAHLKLELDLAHMLSFLDWSAGDENQDGVLTLDDPSVYNPLVFGVSATPSYRITWSIGE